MHLFPLERSAVTVGRQLSTDLLQLKQLTQQFDNRLALQSLEM